MLKKYEIAYHNYAEVRCAHHHYHHHHILFALFTQYKKFINSGYSKKARRPRKPPGL